MALSNLIDIDLIHINVATNSRDDLLNLMATDLFDKGYVKKEYISNVKIREDNYPTGLPLGEINCGIPHSEMEFVLNPCISVAVLKEPIMFRSMENVDKHIAVKLVFMLAIDNGHQQMKVLQDLMTLVQNKEILHQITTSDNKEAILSILSEF